MVVWAWVAPPLRVAVACVAAALLRWTPRPGLRPRVGLSRHRGSQNVERCGRHVNESLELMRC